MSKFEQFITYLIWVMVSKNKQESKKANILFMKSKNNPTRKTQTSNFKNPLCKHKKCNCANLGEKVIENLANQDQ